MSIDSAQSQLAIAARPRPAWSYRRCAKAVLRRTIPRRWLLVSGPAREPSVCLTFDDGPHPVHTPRILDVLRRADVPATFFLIGQYVERHPEIVRRIVDEGHVIGHHTFLHSPESCATTVGLLSEIHQTDQLLRTMTGTSSMLFRPPWGRLSGGGFLGLWRSGYRIVLWNRDPNDCAMKSAAELSEWFDAHPLQGGDILLLHDDQPFVGDALPQLIADVTKRGLRFTTPLAWP